MAAPKRSYELGARAEAAAARKERILLAALELLATQPVEQVTLAAIAERAEVSLKTVVRAYASKDELIVAGVQWLAERERGRREVPVGDVEAAVRMLADRYEALGDRLLGRIALEQRVPALRELGVKARASHLEWLAEVFAAWLPTRKSRARDRRLAALFGATELYVWTTWRRDLGLSLADATLTMRHTIEALLAQFEAQDARAKRGPR